MRFEPGLKLACHSGLGNYLAGKSVSPINVEISPSGVCNANCKHCFYKEIPGMDANFFDVVRMQGLLEELSGMDVKSISWTGGGEPTLHPAFPEFARLANWAGLKQGLFTNCLKEIDYDPSLFSWIRVSKTDKAWPIENLKKLKDCKTVGLCINYTGVEKEIEEALKIAVDLNLTYVQVRPALKMRGEKSSIKIPKVKHPLLQITDYKFFGADEDRNYSLCEAFHFAPFIWQDGDVDVCGYHRKEKQFNLGNLYAQGKEGRFRTIMQRAPDHVEVEDQCQVCCKLNSMNSMIKHIRDLEDVDFP